MHMTSKYDIGQIGQSWCLIDGLIFSIHTHSSDFNENMFLRLKSEKFEGNVFPLYILVILLFFIFWSKSINFKEALPVISQR